VLLIAAGLVFKKRVLIWCGLVLLWLASTSMASGRLTRVVEGGAQRVVARDVSEANAIVVLSEGRSLAPGQARISEWLDGDRFYGGIELFKARKAPLLIFTGGASSLGPRTASEGTILRAYARELGVPDSSILVSGRATNTAEEATEVAKLLYATSSGATSPRPGERPPRPRILLVTSAAHMARARRAFETEGLTVIRFPVDFKGSEAGRFGMISLVRSLVPSAAALLGTENALRELYGRLFYAIRY
jgi:uncharacterized SAM-binding protein YcdF (DUF218 family)